MQQLISLFTLFGGIRPMARELEERPSNVSTWKRVDRIPADKQRLVLERGIALGLPVTPELVIFPSGDVPEAVSIAACAHRPLVTPRTPCSAADNERLGPAQSTKYGKRSAALHTCDRTVQA